MIHIATAWLKGVAHVIRSMHDERISSTLCSTSLSSHSSLISCTSSRTSYTSLRAVASLCTPPKGMYSLDVTYSHTVWNPFHGLDGQSVVVKVSVWDCTAPRVSTGLARGTAWKHVKCAMKFGEVCLSAAWPLLRQQGC